MPSAPGIAHISFVTVLDFFNGTKNIVALYRLHRIGVIAFKNKFFELVEVTESVINSILFDTKSVLYILITFFVRFL